MNVKNESKYDKYLDKKIINIVKYYFINFIYYLKIRIIIYYFIASIIKNIIL